MSEQGVDGIIQMIKEEDEKIRRIEESYAAHNLAPRAGFIATLKMCVYRGKLEEALLALIESKS